MPNAGGKKRIVFLETELQNYSISLNLILLGTQKGIDVHRTTLTLATVMTDRTQPHVSRVPRDQHVQKKKSGTSEEQLTTL